MEAGNPPKLSAADLERHVLLKEVWRDAVQDCAHSVYSVTRHSRIIKSWRRCSLCCYQNDSKKVWKILRVSEGHQRANSVPTPAQTLYVIHNLSTAANKLIHSPVDNSKIGPIAHQNLNQ